MSEQQAATDTSNNPPAGGGAGTDARDENPSLNEILDEWYQDTPSGDEDGQSGKQPQQPSVNEDRLVALERRLAAQDYQQTMNRVVQSVKGDLDADDEFVEFWINKRADENERLQRLWSERDARPADFRKAIGALQGEFQKYYEERFGKPDPNGNNEQRRRIQTAVASGSQASGGPDDDRVADELAKMNDHDFVLRKSEIFRFYENGGGKK